MHVRPRHEGRTEVAYHIPRGVVLFWELRPAFDLMEESRRSEVEQPCEKVETATVRHTNDDVLDAIYTGVFLARNVSREK